jgi:hypothetical protein
VTKSRGILPPKMFWTKDQIKKLIELYPDTKTEDMAKIMGMTVGRIYGKAGSLGLKKSKEYLSSPYACRLRQGDNVGKSTRFTKGQASWNKGMKGLQIGGKETQFKPGTKPPNWRPVGSTRVNVDGYIEVKTKEGKFTWKLLHRENWTASNGPIPKDHAVVFKDGNRLNCDISNLECITLEENMRRNTYHRYPKEIAQLVQLRGALTRQINKREGKKA